MKWSQKRSFRNRIDHGVHGKQSCDFCVFVLSCSFWLFFDFCLTLFDVCLTVFDVCLTLLCASIGLRRLFFHFLTLLCASIGLRLFSIKSEFVYAIIKFLAVCFAKNVFLCKMYLFLVSLDLVKRFFSSVSFQRHSFHPNWP